MLPAYHQSAGETLEFTALQLWPPNSPNLNLVDYSTWGALLEKLHQTCIADLNDLKHWLNMEWAKLDHAVIAAVIRQWCCRCLLTCINAGGGHGSWFTVHYPGWCMPPFMHQCWGLPHKLAQCINPSVGQVSQCCTAPIDGMCMSVCCATLLSNGFIGSACGQARSSKGKGSSLDIAPLTMLDRGTLEPKRQLIGTGCSTVAQASGYS